MREYTHTWDYFKLSVSERQRALSFYIGLTTITYGFVTSLTSKATTTDQTLASFVLFIHIVISLLFYRIETYYRDQVVVARVALMELEKEFQIPHTRVFSEERKVIPDRKASNPRKEHILVPRHISLTEAIRRLYLVLFAVDFFGSLALDSSILIR